MKAWGGELSHSIIAALGRKVLNAFPPWHESEARSVLWCSLIVSRFPSPRNDRNH